MRSHALGRLLRAGLALAASFAVAACGTLATQPAAPATLAGDWQQDVAASDNFERKLAPLLEAQRERMRPRHGSAMAGGSRRDARADEPEPLLMPPEDPDQVRARLTLELRPPAKLRIALVGDTVEVTNDADPVRQFQPGQPVSRIDRSGAASLASGWDHRAFVVRARYTNHSARSWRYELEPASGLLRLGFEANDPEFGRLTLQTRYRRATGVPP